MQQPNARGIFTLPRQLTRRQGEAHLQVKNGYRHDTAYGLDGIVSIGKVTDEKMVYSRLGGHVARDTGQVAQPRAQGPHIIGDHDKMGREWRIYWASAQD